MDNNINEKNIEVMLNDEKVDAVVNTVMLWKRDLEFHYMDKARYERILQDPLLPEGQRSRIEGLLVEVTNRIAEIECYIRAAQPELPSQAEIDASIARIKAKEAGLIKP